MVKLQVVLLVIVLVISCRSSDLTLGYQSNKTKKLKLNGFYWLETPVEGDMSWYLLHFLYQDGTLLQFGGIKGNNNLNNQDYLAKYIAESKTYINRENRTDWGVYIIDGNRIAFEKWEPSSGGGSKTVVRKGKVLNDTTFVITEKLNHYDGKIYHVQDTFRFRAFSPKPDSTNRFIK